MGLELSVGGQGPRTDLELELRTLQDWVRRERTPGVRVVRKPPELKEGDLGALSDVIQVIVATGDVAAAAAGIATAIYSWLQSRRTKVAVTVVDGDTTYEFTQSMPKAEIERLLQHSLQPDA
ncbi:effector-associated constant component EACC1 [Nocardioides speluncae]|uniref:effector-associated constant component EACC1 n=1 Tax=Nocardioides speluncae TaxID=2670337 RepID=UPI000D69DE09|nr:hypothetical protein [Nocardioides speluncae]